MSEWQPQIREAINRLETAFCAVERKGKYFSEDLYMLWNHADHVAKMTQCWRAEEGTDNDI